MAGSGKILFQAAGILLISALLLSSVGLVYHRTLSTPTNLSWTSWAFSDLLINYDGGFVRRGLLGALIKHLAGQRSELPIANAVVFISFSSFATLVTLLTIISKKRDVLNTIFALLLPGGVFTMAVGNQYFFRKEITFFIALSIVAIAFSLTQKIAHQSTRRISAWGVVLLIFMFGIVLPFVHEGFIFLSAPASVFLLHVATQDATSGTHIGKEKKIGRLLVCAYLSVAVVMFLLMAWFKGNGEIVKAIWVNLPTSDRVLISDKGQVVGGMSALTWGLARGISMSVKVIISGMFWYWLVPIMAGALYCLSLASLRIGRKADDSEGELYQWLLCYLALLISTLPMFFLGWDWGRWLASTNISFVILYFAINRLNLDVRFPLPYAALVRDASSRYQQFVLRNKFATATAMLIFAVTFRIPECCIGSNARPAWLYGLLSRIYLGH